MTGRYEPPSWGGQRVMWYKNSLFFLPFALFLVFCAPAPAEYKVQKHFFCDYLGAPNLKEEQNHPNQTFDRMFSYRQFSDGHYQAQFRIAGDWIPVKYKKTFIYHLETNRAGKSFEIQRFNLKTYKLILSHVYHLTKEQYHKNLEERKTNPYLAPYSNKPLPFSDVPLPENHIKVGFDRSSWQCHEVRGFRYFLKKGGVILMQILSAT